MIYAHASLGEEDLVRSENVKSLLENVRDPNVLAETAKRIFRQITQGGLPE